MSLDKDDGVYTYEIINNKINSKVLIEGLWFPSSTKCYLVVSLSVVGRAAGENERERYL